MDVIDRLALLLKIRYKMSPLNVRGGSSSDIHKHLSYGNVSYPACQRCYALPTVRQAARSYVSHPACQRCYALPTVRQAARSYVSHPACQRCYALPTVRQAEG